VDDCTFCRIVRGELPADIRYQDDTIMAFKDINPRAPFHVLVVPREHIRSLAETDDEALLGHLVRVAAQLAKDAGFGERGFRVQSNTGPEGGQDVFHLHWHVYAGRPLPPLPRA
jgi:histidine triad (HIT) family protein